jgi:hypothetical protein
MIPRNDWILIKSRLSRTPALRVLSKHRNSVKEVLGFLSEHYPSARPVVFVLPISTMQWSSVVLGRNETRVAFVDVEQANALSFLLARGAWLEMPVFSYAEFMIRAAEALYDDGDLMLAAALSEQTNNRLREYCKHHQSDTTILRPKALDPLLIPIMEADILLRFIIGHEIGHLLQRAGNIGVGKLFDWIAILYEEMHLDKSGPIHRERFLGPEIVQKFDSAGRADGYAIQGTKFAGLFTNMRDQQIREAQSDALGIIMASVAAIGANIPANALLGTLVTSLEHTEMLMTLRRVVPRLPRGEKLAAIPVEHTGLISRHSILIRVARALKEGTAPVPESILKYWATLPEVMLSELETMGNDGRLEQIALRPEIVLRGGIELGLQGRLERPSDDALLIEKLGPAAGNLIVAQAHRRLSEEHFKVENSFDWSPETGIDGVLYGFATAIRDIAATATSETRARNDLTLEDLTTKEDQENFVEFLRSARTQISSGRLNEDWAASFKTLLKGVARLDSNT